MTDSRSLTSNSSIRSKIFFLVPIGTMRHLARRVSVFILAGLCESEILVPIGTIARILVPIETKMRENREAIFLTASRMLNLQRK